MLDEKLAKCAIKNSLYKDPKKDLSRKAKRLEIWKTNHNKKQKYED